VCLPRTHLPRAQVLGRDDVRHSAGRPQVLRLRLTRQACGKLEHAWLVKWRENGSAVARAAGRLNSRPLGSTGGQMEHLTY
jgi:hypothetical protein